MAVSNSCEQCHVSSRRERLNTDLFDFELLCQRTNPCAILDTNQHFFSGTASESHYDWSNKDILLIPSAFDASVGPH